MDLQADDQGEGIDLPNDQTTPFLRSPTVVANDFQSQRSFLVRELVAIRIDMWVIYLSTPFRVLPQRESAAARYARCGERYEPLL